MLKLVTCVSLALQEFSLKEERKKEREKERKKRENKEEERKKGRRSRMLVVNCTPRCECSHMQHGITTYRCSTLLPLGYEVTSLAGKE